MAIKVISLKDIARGLVPQSEAALDDAVLEGAMPVYKKYGETPLECLKRLRQCFPQLEKATMSYAGRLDPLAEGLMLVLIGEDTNKDRQKYLKLNKTYEVDVLFGISTDTGDLLGMPVLDEVTKANKVAEFDLYDKVNMTLELEKLKGKQSFPYPAYSSKTINGKPLFEWAKEGRLAEITIPKTDVFIEDIVLLETYVFSAEDLFVHVTKAIDLVHGDFRQKDILTAWHEQKINNFSKKGFQVMKLQVKCSSGTYMRTLAEEIGKVLHTCALAYKIKRTQIDSINISEDLYF